MPTYVRFVVADIHESSGKELGIFHAVLGLRETGKLEEHEEELHDLTRQWFNENLEKPARFTASKKSHSRRSTRVNFGRFLMAYGQKSQTNRKGLVSGLVNSSHSWFLKPQEHVQSGFDDLV